MISQLALIAWIIAGASLFMLTTPTRAFILAYAIGILVLPVERLNAGEGVIYITYSLRIDKYIACHLAVLIGTVAFCPHVLSRFRLGLIDAVFGVLLLGAVVTSLVNGTGAKDGFSSAVMHLTGFYPAMVFARMYVTTLSELHTVMRTLVGAAVIYGVICIAEARLSPQLHRLVYGYFQHAFAQFMRYGWFRPAGMMRHAIEVSFFMGTAAVIAVGLTARKMFPPLWGMIPGWAVVGWLLISLFMTFTVSGYIAFLAGAGMLWALLATQKRAFLLVLPCVSVVWMLLRYFGEIDADSIINFVAKFDVARAESLSYRLNAEAVYLFNSDLNPLFGGGTSIVGRGKPAVDAFWLINLGFYGWVGLLCWLVIWASGIVALYRYWPKLNQMERTLCAIGCAAIAPVFIDYLVNSFPSHLLMILTVGLATVIVGRVKAPVPRQVVAGPLAPAMTEARPKQKPFAHIATRPIV